MEATVEVGEASECVVGLGAGESVGGEAVSNRSEGVGEHVDLLVARLRFTEGLPGATSGRVGRFLAFL